MAHRTSLPLHPTEDDRPRKVIRKGKSRRIVKRSKGDIESHVIYKRVKSKKSKTEDKKIKHKKRRGTRRVPGNF